MQSRSTSSEPPQGLTRPTASNAPRGAPAPANGHRQAIRPIFLLSPPRAGSTLVQRVLGAHSEIATVSEPWLLLPLLAPLHPGLPASGVRDPLVARALEDFCGELPQGRDDYRAAVRDLTLRLYARAAGRTSGFFLDKTPVYHLVVDEIARTFPEARLVFLWRHPLSIVASAAELWDGGRWEVNRYVLALFQSIADLAPAYSRHRERALAVRYEDLVGGGTSAWQRLMSGLGLELEPGQLERFGEVELNGRMGDPLAAEPGSVLSAESIDRWREVVANPVRKAWCARYLRWIGAERLAAMGYDLGRLLGELDAVKGSLSGSAADLRSLGGSLARELVRARVPPHSGGPSTWRALLR